MSFANDGFDDNMSFNKEYEPKNGFKNLLKTNPYLEKNYIMTEMIYEKGKEFEINREDYFDYPENFEEKNNDDTEERFFTNQKTNDNTDNKRIFKINKVKKIFLIKKEIQFKKKKGRKKKDTFVSSKSKHDKNSQDNIIQKIKRNFVSNAMNYINIKYKDYLIKNGKKEENLLKKINPEICKNYSTEDNKNFLESDLRQLFSNNISKKNTKIIRKYSKEYNKIRINNLLEKKEATEVINILELTVKNLYKKYISNEITEFNLNDELNTMAKKHSEEYIAKYRTKANNFIKFCEGKVKKLKKTKIKFIFNNDNEYCEKNF